jgi:hypothetical protein
VELRVDGSSLGVRFAPSLNESEVRQLLGKISVLSIGQAQSTIFLPAKTVYLDNALGTTPQEALNAAQKIRAMPGVLSASPRLWALEDPYYLTEDILVRWKQGAPLPSAISGRSVYLEALVSHNGLDF